MDKNQALNRAMALCSRKEYCESAIRNKLQFWEVEPVAVDEIIEILIREKFIDDMRYALAYARDKIRINYWGKVKVRYMLSMERVKSTVIDQALGEIEDETYSEVLTVLLKRKSREMKNEPDPRIKRQKLIKFAQGRGFEIDIILRVMKEGD